MNTIDLPAQIREYVDTGTSPITSGEIKARAVLKERAVRRAPVRLGVAATGLAAAGIAGALVVSQFGGGDAAGTRAVLTAAMLKHVAGASHAAMTSGQAEIDWTSSVSPASVTQDIAFDGANWNDVMSPAARPASSTPGGLISIWTGQSINRVVDGQAYHYPAIKRTPQGTRFAPGWMRIIVPGAAQPLTIPDPRTLLGVLSPSAGFVKDGYTIAGGIKLEHLRATTPGTVPVTPLDPIIQGEPTNPRISALDLWVDPSDVVLKAEITVTGTGATRGPATPQSVTVTVTFSQIGQPQAITAPAHFITLGGKR